MSTKLIDIFQAQPDPIKLYYLEDVLDCYEQAVRLCPSERIYHQGWRGLWSGVDYLVHKRNCLCPVHGYCVFPSGELAEILPSADWQGWRQEYAHRGGTLLRQLADITNNGYYYWKASSFLTEIGVRAFVVSLKKRSKMICPACYLDFQASSKESKLIESPCPCCGEVVTREFFSRRAEHRDESWVDWRMRCNQLMTIPDKIYKHK